MKFAKKRDNKRQHKLPTIQKKLGEGVGPSLQCRCAREKKTNTVDKTRM
jgi:hypothetical protein